MENGVIFDLLIIAFSPVCEFCRAALSLFRNLNLLRLAAFIFSLISDRPEFGALEFPTPLLFWCKD